MPASFGHGSGSSTSRNPAADAAVPTGSRASWRAWVTQRRSTGIGIVLMAPGAGARPSWAKVARARGQPPRSCTTVGFSSLPIASARARASELKPPVESIDLHEVIVGACDIIQAIVGPAVRVGQTHLAKGDSRVYARQVDLDRILLNVVCNAAAAMQSGGVLVIETSHLPPGTETPHATQTPPFGKLRLTFADTGHGVPMRDVWEVRDSTQLPRRDGTGIGLSSVSLILLRLGGGLHDQWPGRRGHRRRDHPAAVAPGVRTRPLIARSRKIGLAAVRGA